MISENLENVYSKINRACERAGRDPKEVTLIAVSKTKPVEMMEEAIECGTITFGENKVQEIVKKKPQLPDNVNWHMIGHLQRNKVKQLVGSVKMIHSVDSIRLAEQIEKDFGAADECIDVLLEVNVAKEESKFGFMPEEVMDAVEKIAQLPHIKLRGLMTIAPFVNEPEENRPIFRKLHKILVDINAKNIDNIYMGELSMGMTGDYEVAVEEGATFVRVGTGIFGERNYTH